MKYGGYLASHIDVIAEGFHQGLSPRAIAEHLYQRGARASHAIPTREDHIRSLRAMVVYVLMRLGLRVRIPRAARTLTAKPIGNGVWEVTPAGTS